MHADTLAGAVDGLTNARGRSGRHVLTGLALTAGAVAASALVARLHAPARDQAYSDDQALEKPAFTPQARVFAIVWPPLFLAITLSGLRIWNAPTSPARTQALTLWGVVQALNTTWMALGPRRLGGQVAAAVASLGTTGAYIWRARRVDPAAARMVTPYLGWIGFANVLTEELWRKNRTAPTIH
ncbi:MAG: TspO/MBR family protein [Phenylobacterium sp.]